MVGAGQTIVIIDSYGSPTIPADLAAFDAGYGCSERLQTIGNWQRCRN